jgi:hypothetical protein
MQKGEWDVVYSEMSGQSEIFRWQPGGDYDVYGNDGATHGKHMSVSSELRGRVDKLPVDAVPAQPPSDHVERMGNRKLPFVTKNLATYSLRTMLLSRALHLMCEVKMIISAAFCNTPTFLMNAPQP